MNNNLFNEDFFYDQPLSEKNPELISLRRLWRSVILQAMLDAVSNSKYTKRKGIGLKALRWLKGNSRDFLDVCHYAGLDPQYVVQKAQIWIKNHNKKILDYTFNPSLFCGRSDSEIRGSIKRRDDL